MPKKPVVSVVMITYNHEPYIEKALKSVLSQHTNFEFEIVIGDDCSTDNTQQIIRTYAKKFPTKIKPILREHNIGANHNYLDVLTRCHSPFLAFLEGDDFWEGTDRLQKQYNFLKRHPEYIGISGWCNFVNEHDQILWQYQKIHPFLYKKHLYTFRSFQEGYIPNLMNSMLCHNVFKSLDFDWQALYEIDPILGDQINFFLLSRAGSIYCTHHILLNYRYLKVSLGDNFSSTHSAKQNNSLYKFNYSNKLETLYNKLTGAKVSLRRRKAKCLTQLLRNCFTYPSKSNVKQIITLLKQEPHPILLLFMCIKLKFTSFMK